MGEEELVVKEIIPNYWRVDLGGVTLGTGDDKRSALRSAYDNIKRLFHTTVARELRATNH